MSDQITDSKIKQIFENLKYNTWDEFVICPNVMSAILSDSGERAEEGGGRDSPILTSEFLESVESQNALNDMSTWEWTEDDFLREQKEEQKQEEEEQIIDLVDLADLADSGLSETDDQNLTIDLTDDSNNSIPPTQCKADDLQTPPLPLLITEEEALFVISTEEGLSQKRPKPEIGKGVSHLGKNKGKSPLIRKRKKSGTEEGENIGFITSTQSNNGQCVCSDGMVFFGAQLRKCDHCLEADCISTSLEISLRDELMKKIQVAQDHLIALQAQLNFLNGVTDGPTTDGRTDWPTDL